MAISHVTSFLAEEVYNVLFSNQDKSMYLTHEKPEDKTLVKGTKYYKDNEDIYFVIEWINKDIPSMHYSFNLDLIKYGLQLAEKNKVMVKDPKAKGIFDIYISLATENKLSSLVSINILTKPDAFNTYCGDIKPTIVKRARLMSNEVMYVIMDKVCYAYTSTVDIGTLSYESSRLLSERFQRYKCMYIMKNSNSILGTIYTKTDDELKAAAEIAFVYSARLLVSSLKRDFEENPGLHTIVFDVDSHLFNKFVTKSGCKVIVYPPAYDCSINHETKLGYFNTAFNNELTCKTEYNEADDRYLYCVTRVIN